MISFHIALDYDAAKGLVLHDRTGEKPEELDLKRGQYVFLTSRVCIIIIIIITRPKPAYGRQGLAGLWGQDTDQAGTFWGVVNISLCAFSPQLG